MKRLLMIAAAVLAFAGAATAGELPRDYRGAWCADADPAGETFMRKANVKNCKQWMVVRARGFTDADGERICRFISIRKAGQDPKLDARFSRFAVTARCRAEEDPPYTVKMELSSFGNSLNLKEEERP
jgi:hypothetical protein